MKYDSKTKLGAAIMIAGTLLKINLFRESM